MNNWNSKTILEDGTLELSRYVSLNELTTSIWLWQTPISESENTITYKYKIASNRPLEGFWMIKINGKNVWQDIPSYRTITTSSGTEVYLICDDVEQTVTYNYGGEMTQRTVIFTFRAAAVDATDQIFNIMWEETKFEDYDPDVPDPDPEPEPDPDVPEPEPDPDPEPEPDPTGKPDGYLFTDKDGYDFYRQRLDSLAGGDRVVYLYTSRKLIDVTTGTAATATYYYNYIGTNLELKNWRLSVGTERSLFQSEALTPDTYPQYGVNIDDPNTPGVTYSFYDYTNSQTVEMKAFINEDGTTENVLIHLLGEYSYTEIIDGEYFNKEDTYQILETQSEAINLVDVGGYPTIDPTFTEMNPDVIAVFGNDTTFVEYCSQIKVSLNPTLSDGATVKTVEISCGGKTYKFDNATFNIDTNGYFDLYLVDSKNRSVRKRMAVTLHKYFIPDIQMTAEAPNGEGECNIQINGSCYNDMYKEDWGSAYNDFNLTYYYRIKGTTTWTKVSPDVFNLPVPTDFSWDTASGTGLYRYKTTITDLNYTQIYEMYASLSDSLSTVSTKPIEVYAYPVFDWSKNDFNINVPTTIMNMPIGRNTVLWEDSRGLELTGGWIYLDGLISECASGVVLVFSPEAFPSYYITHFVPKWLALLEKEPVIGFVHPAQDGSTAEPYIQYVRFRDNRIAGEGMSYGKASYITSGYKLKYVIGV